MHYPQPPYQPWDTTQANTPYPPPPPPYQPYPPPMKPKRRRRVWLILSIIGGSLVFLCIACTALAAVLPKPPATTTQAPTSVPMVTQQATVAVIVPTATATSKPATPPSPTPMLAPTPTSKAQPTQAPTPKPTAKPTPTPKHCNAVDNNPWCYNFDPNGGHLITNPPSTFCDYFPCIATFVSADDPDGGYVVECADGDFSQSGGESGSCSHHGGESRPLYSH